MHTILVGDAREQLASLPDQSVQTCVTSPPYYGLRDYGVDGQIGLESTVDAYVAALVDVFRDVRRVLKDDGTLWLNLGDSYAGGGRGPGSPPEQRGFGRMSTKTLAGQSLERGPIPDGLKSKDLIGIPWRVAFALQADGWYLRQDIIWCLSGGTKVYARTQKGDMPMTVKDLYRLDPATVQLWNGAKWTQLLGMSQSSRNADEMEITLRSGEKIACTPTHKFPTERGLLAAAELQPGDRLIRTTLPQPDAPLDSQHMTDDAAWFAGLYLAEGSRSGRALQIAGHVKETERWERVQAIAAAYGGSATRTIDGNRMDIRVYGKMLHALVDTFVSGTTAKTKHLNPRCWRYSNAFLHAFLQGYLSGDGHWDEQNARWRLGFTRNDALAADLRTLAARLDAHLVLNQASVALAGKRFPIYRGELRFERSGHWNQKHTEEIVSIGKARCRVVYDLGVADEPHVFALASGILTHNSKPNPMPESVRDRCTKSHEYIFLFSKYPLYYYDADAIAEPVTLSTVERLSQPNIENQRGSYRVPGKTNGAMKAVVRKQNTGQRFGGHKYGGDDSEQSRTKSGNVFTGSETRNKRSVWTVSTKPYSGAHFAVFPPEIPETCIKAGSREGDTVLDPFAGSGTTGEVAEFLGRRVILIELNPAYVPLIEKRLAQRTIWDALAVAD